MTAEADVHDVRAASHDVLQRLENGFVLVLEVLQRFDTGYKETVAAITPQFDQAKARLAALLLAMGTATTAPTPRVLFGIISPSSDPVTGTGT